MRPIAMAVALVCGSLLSGAASAKTIVAVKTTYYRVSGQTGSALIDSMDRKGPRHGFTTRAIAQTGYTVGWDFGWEQTNGACRLAAATGTLDMTYTYPQASGPMTPDVKRRWERFLVGVRKHEQTHGAIAKSMVGAVERSLKGLRVARDPNCKTALAQAKRRISAIYEDYESRQVAFDKREHQRGGNVEKLLVALKGRD